MTRNKSNKPRLPKLRHHKGSGQGAVVLDGTWIYLGKFGTAETEREYRRVVGEWLAGEHRLPVPADEVTVAEVLATYKRECKRRYRGADGNLPTDFAAIERALKTAGKLYGHVRAVEFGPLALRAVRDDFVRDKLSRSYVNRLVWRIKRAFEYAVEMQMIPVEVHQRLSTVRGLTKGRSEARESDPVQPVPEKHVDAVRPFVSRQVWALIEFQRWSGARPGEAVTMRPADIDRSGDVWFYRPRSHKTAYRGLERVVAIGKRAQRAIAPFLVGRDPEAFLFSPREAEQERLAALHEARTTPLSCGNVPGSNRKAKPTMQPGERYEVASYRRAVTRACDLAKVPRWTPHRLRHSAATRIRDTFDSLDAVQAVLGHRHLATSLVYAKLNVERAAEVAREIG